jgi:hypothetical protein
MSTDYGSNIIVGVRLKDIYSYEIKEDSKTQYDLNTGKPYQVKVSRLYGKFGNKDLHPIEPHPTEYRYGRKEYYQDFDFLGKDISIHLPSNSGFNDPEYCMKHGIVGTVICIGDDTSSNDVSFEEVMKTIEKIKQALAIYGCTENPKLFSQVSIC